MVSRLKASRWIHRHAINLYSRYGIALANVGQCGEALQISQKIAQTAPDDENALYNAQVMIDTCREQAEARQATGTPSPTRPHRIMAAPRRKIRPTLTA